MRKGKRGQKVIPSASRGALNPKDRLRQQAYGLRNTRNFAQAKPLLEELYKLEPDNVPLALDLGEAYMETEDFASATSLYAKLIEKDPKNINAVTNLGGSLIRQGKLNDARSILEYALQLDPKSIHARINLGSVLQASGERKANLDNALEAVQIDPSSSLAFNNLGSAFSDMAMFKEARHAYETAVMLDPDQIDALINLAAVEARLGDSKASAEMYERVLKLLPKEAAQRAEAVKFYASFEYLKQGVLEKGWDYYEGGFSPLVPAKGARTPRRNFDVPRWDGSPLNGKKLLVWREQGLGDELLFATCLHELEALGGNIIVECDARLVTVFQRSFPQYTIRAETFLPNHGMKSPFSDFDLHLPMGSLMKYFRRDIKDFERSGAYIKPDPVKVAKFQERLAPYKDDYRLVGICWRSGKLDPVRNLSYTMLDEWGEVLQTPGFKFVNLQYGECEAELKEAEEKYGVEILRWPDLNLRNDLDDIFALMTCLDAVASVQTAVLIMARGIGILSVGVKAGGWTAFGKNKSSCWFDKNTNIRKAEDILLAVGDLRIKEFIYEQLGYRIETRLNPLSLRDMTRNLDTKSFGDLNQKIISHLMQNPTTSVNKILIGEVLESAPDAHYGLLRPAVDCYVGSGLVIKGIQASKEMAHRYLSIASKAGREGDWFLADRALQAAEDLDKSLYQLSLPEFAWRKFLDGKLDEATHLACQALNHINWHTAVKFHLPRLLAESGDYESAFQLAELSSKTDANLKGMFSAISQSALTDSQWELILDATRREEGLAQLDLYSLVLKFTALLRLNSFNFVLTEMKLERKKLSHKHETFFSTFALLNMHNLSESEFFTLLNDEKGFLDNHQMASRAELIYLELEDEVDRVDIELKVKKNLKTISSLLLYDLCLASLIRGRESRAWSFIFHRGDHDVKSHLLQHIVQRIKRPLKEAESDILSEYRKSINFSRNGFLILDYFQAITNTGKLLGLEEKDIHYRRNADLGWFLGGLRKLNANNMH